MGLLKEKTKYRPTRAEVTLAWVFTAASGAVAAWWILTAWLQGR
ncbi:MAG: hypothetical protein DHS20C21_12050 [Gemmatimonadota bacterium]|nr:MAG: hypothetical protein DHS20C21_12050 [Gemmatimonadota bacterium]